MKKKYPIAMVLLITQSFFCQSNEPRRYFDEDLNVTYNKSKVMYYSIMEFHKDSLKNNEIIFYLNGKVRSYTPYRNYITEKREGITEEFYESGKLMSQRVFLEGLEQGLSKEYYENDTIRSKIMYQKGKIHGRLQRYWENGKLKRYESYKEGKFINGKCFDSIGNEVPFYAYDVRPEFPGGMNSFYDYVRKNFGKRNLEKIKGTMRATFVVDPDGKLVDIKIITAIDPLVDKEFVDVLKKSPKWKPAMLDGEYNPKLIMLPLTIVESFAPDLEFKDFTKSK